MSEGKTNSVWHRFLLSVSFVLVAGVAARVSYSHIREVAVLGHQPDDIAALLPLAVDGLMLIATLAINEDKRRGRYPRGWARFGFWFGVMLSIAANVSATAAFYTDALSIGVAAAAPILLLISVEIVARPGKPKGEPEPTVSVVPDTVAELESPNVPEAPVSPAVSAGKPRGPYGPRNGDRYSKRHQDRLASGK